MCYPDRVEDEPSAAPLPHAPCEYGGAAGLDEAPHLREPRGGMPPPRVALTPRAQSSLRVPPRVAKCNRMRCNLGGSKQIRAECSLQEGNRIKPEEEIRNRAYFHISY